MSSLPSRVVCAILLWLALIPGILLAQNSTESIGIVRIQAEQPTANIPRAINGVSYAWVQSTGLSGFTGTGFMEAEPNDGTSVLGGWSGTSPELQYTVSFSNPGTYFVWMRVFAETAENALVHIGLNGASPAAATLATSQFNTWKWVNTGPGSPVPVAITVPSAGNHTLSVWMGDAGFRLDRILLTRNPNFTPEASADFWKNQNIYQIITDRFFDGNPGNNNFYGEADPTIGNKTHGGDFLGIEKKLDYIKALGATAIWISPVVKNGKGDFDYHGYAGTDFYTTDPRFGSIGDLQRLVAEANRRGILVVNDVVVNHASTWVDSTDSGWAAFRYPPSGYNLRYNSGGRTFAPPFDPASIQAAFGNTNLANIFNNNGGTQNWSDPTQVELGELVSLDDFRTQSSFVRDRMAEIYSWWINTAGFDAFRIDTVKHVEMGFWDNWCPRIRAAAAAADKPNFFQFGEVYDGSDAKCGSYTGSKTTAPFKMDSVVDYPLYYQVGSVFGTATGATRQIEDRYNNLNTWNYDQSALNSLVTFIDNHDLTRFLNAGGGTARLQVALAFLYTARGIPCLYYGTEQDFDGGGDPSNREDMFDGQFEGGPSAGDNFNMTSPRFKLVARLNNLRRLYPSLRTGVHWNQWNNPNGPGLLAYSRRLGAEEAYVVLNTASTQQTIPQRPTIHPPGTVIVNLFNPSEKLTVSAGTSGWEISPFTAQPNSYAIFVAESQVKALDPVVETISPAHDATSIPTGSAITLSFGKPMDTASTQAAFSTTPATTGLFAWSANNTVVTYTPAGMLGNTLYTVRISEAARDSTNRPLFGAFESRFATAASSGASQPAVASQASSVTGDTTAFLSASVNPNGAATTLYFQYGPTSSYGSNTTNQTVASGTAYVTRNASLTGLVPGTTYHYRVVSTNSAGTTFGPDSTFTTTVTVPETTAITSPASAVTSVSATLNAIVNPNGNPTSASFQYGDRADNLANTTTVQNLGIGSIPQNLAATLDGLQPDTVYYYRVVATNPEKTIQGALLSFSTLSVKPSLSSASAQNIQPDRATLAVTVNPNGSDSAVWFEYGPDSNYGNSTPSQTIAASNTAAVPVTALIQGLAPGQIHHFRAVASNSFGTTFGSDQTFTTGYPPPTVTTGGASGVTTASANLTATINPNGPETTYWFEYGTTSALGSSTMAAASDNGESYTTLAYSGTGSNSTATQNGGTGLSAFRTYVSTSSSRGGIRLVTANSTAGSTAGRQIDDAKSMCVFAGTSTTRGTASTRRAVSVPRQFGTASFSVRFDIANSKGFTGVNLKSADGSSFGANELLSVGMMPAADQLGGNTALVVTDKSGQRNIDLGSEIRGAILDVQIEFDCVSGTYSCGVKFRSDSEFRKIQGELKQSGASIRVAWLGFINGSNTGSNAQNLIFDNLAVLSPSSAGAGNSAVAVSSPLSGLTANATYYYRAVAANSAGQSSGTTTTFFTGQNTAPTISNIPNQTVAEDSATGAISFVIGDSQTAPGSLSLSATSGNQTLVPDSGIVFGGSGANRTLIITPAPNQAGNATITVTVGDGGLTASDSFVLSVTPINDAPTVSQIPNQNLSAGAASSAIPFSIQDFETAAGSLVVSGSSSNPTLIPNANLIFGGSGANRTLSITPAPSQTGLATITISVNDGNLTTTSVFGVSVGAANDAPALADLQNLEIEEDGAPVLVNLAVSDSESPAEQLVVTATSGNPGLIPASNLVLSGSGANRSLSVSPAPNQTGNSTITVTVSDGFSTTSKSFLLTVAGVNDSPVIGVVPDQKTNAGVAVGPLAFSVGDVETAASSLIVTVSSGNPSLVPPTNILLGGSGATRTITLMPAGNQGGNATITLTVGDGIATTSSQFVLSVNSAPTISDIPDQTAFQGFATAPISFTVGDAETSAESLSVSAFSGNQVLVPGGGLVIEGNGADRSLVVTPASNQTGNATITVSVSDGSASSSKTFTLSVVPSPDISVEKTNGSDSSADPIYGDGGFPSKNGGVGFGNWTLSTLGSGGSYIGGSGLSKRSLAIYAGGLAGTSAVAVRPLVPALEVGESLQIQLGYTGVANGGEIGIRFRSAGSHRLILRFLGGQSEWQLNDGGSNFGTGISWAGGTPGVPMTVSFTRQAGNGYSIQITSGVQSLTGNNFTGSSGEMAIDSVEIYSIAQGGGENVGFDNFVRIVPISGAVDFGSRSVGSFGAPVSFVVRNTGAGPLGGLAVAANGTHAGDFLVSTPAVNSLAPGEKAAFTLAFSPKGGGSRNASLLIASNDPDENPVAVPLGGIGVNERPTISDIPDQTTAINTVTGPISFTVDDTETATANLTVTASSADEALVPAGNIVLGGGGAKRTISLAPAPNRTGNTTITLTVDDGDLSASESFVFTVQGGGFASWGLLDSLPADRRGPTDTNGSLNLPNLVAYAMGLDPLTATAADLPALKSIDTSNGTATISYRRSKNAHGVRLQLVGSTNLEGGVWSNSVIVRQSLQDSGDHEVVEVEVSLPPGDRYFLRLRAGID